MAIITTGTYYDVAIFDDGFHLLAEERLPVEAGGVVLDGKGKAVARRVLSGAHTYYPGFTWLNPWLRSHGFTPRDDGEGRFTVNADFIRDGKIETFRRLCCD